MASKKAPKQATISETSQVKVQGQPVKDTELHKSINVETVLDSNKALNAVKIAKAMSAVDEITKAEVEKFLKHIDSLAAFAKPVAIKVGYDDTMKEWKQNSADDSNLKAGQDQSLKAQYAKYAEEQFHPEDTEKEYNEKEFGELRGSDAEVEFKIGETISLGAGSFGFIRLDIGIKMPCDPDNVDVTYEAAMEWSKDRFYKARQTLIDEHNANKPKNQPVTLTEDNKHPF